MTFEPSWESLRQHTTPEWFRDAKFGVWAHWGAQSVGRSGDWYARHLYGPHVALADWETRRPKRQYEHRLATFGDDPDFGAKDLLGMWRAEAFDPDALIDLYASSGAKFFMSMAVHCDNVALWDSTEQPWNTAAYGPRQDIVGGWERAARNAGLPFGLSFHNHWTWRWLDVAHGVNTATGKPNDGRLTRADGAGLWWDGLDPRDLYLEPHALGAEPSAAWVHRFYRMAREATAKYDPEAVYFDDMRMPFDAGSVTETSAAETRAAGLEYLAWYYERARGGGVVSIKDVPDADRGAVLLDSERRQLEGIQAEPWQFDTSDGEWFDCDSDDPLFHARKHPRQVIHTLIDVVSKNGTLLLNIPQRADGTIDDHARGLLKEIGEWLAIVGEGIYGTRPWRVYGEGPTALAASRAVHEVAGYNEGDLPYSPEDVRYTSRGSTVYATLMAWPNSGEAVLRSWTRADGERAEVSLLGWGAVESRLEADGLHVRLPQHPPTQHAHMLRVEAR